MCLIICCNEYFVSGCTKPRLSRRLQTWMMMCWCRGQGSQFGRARWSNQSLRRCNFRLSIPRIMYKYYYSRTMMNSVLFHLSEINQKTGPMHQQRSPPVAGTWVVPLSSSASFILLFLLLFIFRHLNCANVCAFTLVHDAIIEISASR